MSDCSFAIISRGKTIYEGGDEKSELFSKRTRRSTKANNKVVYPIFEEAATHTEGDLFWIKIMEDASRNIFPKMYRYKDGILSFKQKTKLTSKEICQDDPILCLKNMQDFMRGNGLYSVRDNAVKMEEINKLRDEASKVELEWKNIRSKKTKKLLIARYLAYLGKRYDLTRLELSRLINLARIANSVGMIGTPTIVMENDQIVDIKIICFDPETRDFFLDAEINIPKIVKTKKNTDDVPEDEETIQLIKPGGINVSKSRLTDWSKFATILGKRMGVHDKLPELERQIRTKSTPKTMESVPEDKPLKIKRKLVIAIKPRSKNVSSIT